MDQPSHLPSGIYTDSHSNDNLYPVLYLKDYYGSLCLLGKSQIHFDCPLFLGNNRQHMSECDKNDFSLGKESFKYCYGSMLLGTFCGVIASAALAADASLVSILLADDWA